MGTPASCKRSRAFADAGIERRGVEHVLAIIIEKIAQSAGQLIFADAGKNAADQRGRAVADIRINQLVVKRRKSHPGASGVHGIGEVAFGIDQGSVQIED